MVKQISEFLIIFTEKIIELLAPGLNFDYFLEKSSKIFQHKKDAEMQK